MRNGRLGRACRLVAALSVAVVPFVVAVPPASAGVGFLVVPTVPALVSVGQTGIPASLRIKNGSTPPNDVGIITLSQITLVPSCAAFTFSNDCAPAAVDIGVFQVSATGTGEANTVCVGVSFTIAPVPGSTTGMLSLTPATTVTLQPPGTANGADTCTVDFTLSVLKVPTKDLDSTVAGLQTEQIGAAQGTSSADGQTGGASGTSRTTVAQATTSIATVATASGTVGGTVTDTATLTVTGAQGASAGGNIVFNLYGPTDAGCAGSPVFTSTKAVAGAGSYTSDPYTIAGPGTYHWTASYGGDVNNAPAVGACGAAGETLVAAAVTTTTTATPPSPAIKVSKLVDPSTRPQPGGNFTFTVAVTNTSTVESLRITSLIDNIYGDLATRSGSSCGTLIGIVLAKGATSPSCTFTVSYTGVSGATQTDTVTATGIGTVSGTTVRSTAQATITLTPIGTPVGTPNLAFTGDRSGGRILFAGALVAGALLMLVVRGRRRGSL